MNRRKKCCASLLALILSLLFASAGFGVEQYKNLTRDAIA
jgi:hypothetical protein